MQPRGLGPGRRGLATPLVMDRRPAGHLQGLAASCRAGRPSTSHRSLNLSGICKASRSGPVRPGARLRVHGPLFRRRGLPVGRLGRADTHARHCEPRTAAVFLACDGHRSEARGLGAWWMSPHPGHEVVWALVGKSLALTLLPFLVVCHEVVAATATRSDSGGEGSGTPLQYSRLGNPMGGGAWWAAVHGVVTWAAARLL